MKDFIKLIRVKHWIKNFLIFIPLICSHNFGFDNIVDTILAFFSFSFVSSSIYIINDIKDIEKDKLHPKKCQRPIASGKIKIKDAICLAIVLFILALFLNFLSIKNIFSLGTLFLFLYFIINLGYSLGLKNVEIVDIVLLASGFVLRIYYGASIIGVVVSNWLFLTILSASIYIGLGKRKKEFLLNNQVRGVLQKYNEVFLNNFMNISLSLVLVFYSLWVVEQSNKYLFLSIPFLIVVFMEYSLCLEKSDEGDPVTLFFQNKPLLITSLSYALFMLIFMVMEK